VGADFNIEHYNYQLPEERIAKFPLKKRAKSKLLVWKNGDISNRIFEHAPSLIPSKSLLVFNDTRVIAARLLFQKSTGAHIEIFLLHPELPTRDISESMTLQKSSVWFCMIRNKKRWKDGELINTLGDLSIKASYHNHEKNLIRFEWTGVKTFAEIINKAGETPLPPYLRRKPVKDDSSRYQTVYSKNKGAVAAPTAGLHFTETILNQFKAKDIGLEYLTLHVSAGTFKPVEAIDYRNHEMHCEQLVIKKRSILNLIQHKDNLIAVGTTSLRILESLYWYGILLKRDPNSDFFISKNLAYDKSYHGDMTFADALYQVLRNMEVNNLTELHGETEIFIYPGYKIRSAHGLFTNFHLPKSTLLLLISSFVGESWKEIYEEALAKDYRFLSYGDSSLLLR
jgi:S-adenosylmethionine:tRNA ribosyltransferase-isomerase